MGPNDGSYRRHGRVKRDDREQQRGGWRRIVGRMQDGTNGTDFAVPVLLGVESVRQRAELHCKQQQR